VEHDRSRRFGGKIAGRCWERWGFELENASGQPQLAVRPCPFEREALFGSGACAAATARRRRCRTARAAWPTAGRSQKEVHLVRLFRKARSGGMGFGSVGSWPVGPLASLGANWTGLATFWNAEPAEARWAFLGCVCRAHACLAGPWSRSRRGKRRSSRSLGFRIFFE
jgi:hypothetical protein